MNAWPELPYEAWKDTNAALHMWFQVVGKIRLACSPWVNHQWHVTLYVTARGLTTSPIPHGLRVFQADFDFIDHRLAILTSDGAARSIPLEPQPVAAFYGKVMAALDGLGVPVRISKKPNEVPHAVPFDEDRAPRAYDPEYAQRFWRALVQADRVFKIFRGRFRGKCSPVHFFWGSADLAVSRFSGRTAPEHPGGLPNMPDRLVREAYSHECSSCGFWAGGERYPQPMFFSYAYPEPPGFKDALPGYEPALGEYVLPYDAVRTASSPDDKLLDFLQSTYEAAASLAGWDRRSLEMAAPVDFQQALKNPGKTFGGVPEAVESSAVFDAGQKRAILLHWKDQLTQLQKATDENMPGPESDGAGADCLRRVVDALTRLG